jgi:hypothetical protein
MKVKWDDFTVSKYQEYLKLALERGFEFIDFRNYKEYLSKDKKFVLWRHDVDFSIHRAYKLAKVEASLGIKATYFILLHSTAYSIFEKEVFYLIKKIIELGHEVGLHFDANWWGILDEDKLEQKIKFEISILELLFNKEIYVLSLHNPSPDPKNYDKYSLNELSKMYPHYFKDLFYGKIINTYGSDFRNKIKYCSDSNGYWRFNSLYDVLVSPEVKFLQVLTHPEWWTDEPLPPRKRIDRALRGRYEKALKEYDEFLKLIGRPNIDE